MSYTIIFTPETEEQLAAIYHYIATAASPKIAAQYTNEIVSYCEGLTTFPHRGAQHNEIRSGLLLTNYKKKVVIAYTVEIETVLIIGVFYGGQDYQTALDLELDS